MKHRGKLFIWSLSSVLLSVAANASVTKSEASPYEIIAHRNIFEITLPKSEPPIIPPVQRSKVTLLGITTILGDKRAILKIQTPSAAGKPATEQSFILIEGKDAGEIRVVEINEKTATVKINNAGEIALLTFEK
jgi:hypothetical protein